VIEACIGGLNLRVQRPWRGLCHHDRGELLHDQSWSDAVRLGCGHGSL